MDAVRPLPVEEVLLPVALRRALRSPLVAHSDLPPFRNASMDGLAIRAADVIEASKESPSRLRAAGVIPAGHVAARPLAARACMWIMTGAPLPDAADAVVPVEDLEPGTEPGPPWIAIRAPVRAGQNVREAGADLRAGETALTPGRELSPHDLALAAAIGTPTLSVGQTPGVVVISTGDELVAAGESLRPGAIRDSNRPLLG